MEATESAVWAACATELEAYGMRLLEPGLLERELAAGFTGRIGLPMIPVHAPRGTPAVEITPTIAVRHEQTARLVSLLLRLAPDDPSRLSRGIVSVWLPSLLPGRPGTGWLLSRDTAPSDLAREITRAIIAYGFPFMERLTSVAAMTREMEGYPHRAVRRMDLAVLYMLSGRADDARKLLMEVRPQTQDPPTWANKQYEAFLAAFAAHFEVDLDTASWPVASAASPAPVKFRVRESGAVRNALLAIGRADIADTALRLSARQLDQIGDRSTVLFDAMEDKDVARAVGLAAAELIDARH